MAKKMDLTGQTFGRLTVIKEVEPHIQPSGEKKIKWFCECSCGKETLVTTGSLRSGDTKSCGCLREENANRGHNMSKSAEHNTWISIKTRCYNRNSKDYIDYGGRGIKVCDRWLESFENFLEDMGSRPSDDHSIERVNISGDYSPKNCIWIENKKQARNKRKRKDNKSGVTGVYMRDDRWAASWYDLGTGKRGYKSFSVNKYGDDEAFRLACEYRKKMIEKLNEQGAGYSENHGK